MNISPLDAATNELRYLILAIQAEGERRLNDALRAKGIDLTATQSEVLEVLYGSGPLSQGELGDRLVCTKGNVSRLIDRMAAKDLLVRQPDPSDRRRFQVALTAHGRKTIGAAFTVIDDLLGAIRALYSDDELAQLGTLLSRLSDAFGVRLPDRGEPLEERRDQ